MYPALKSAQLTKQALVAPYGIPGQGQGVPEAPQRRKPWVPLLLGGLAAGAGAYGYGKWHPESSFGAFSSGLDKNVINPARELFTPSLAQQEDKMRSVITGGGVRGLIGGVTKPSQLQGTEYYDPNRLQGVADTAGNAAGIGMLGHTAASGGKWLATKAAPQLMERAGMTALGKGLGTGAKLFGRGIPVLSELMTVPDSMQLGDKLNDSLGLHNGFARGALKAGTTGLGLLSGLIPYVGGFIPMGLNGALNHFNNRNMLRNQMNGRLSAMTDQFRQALVAKQQGFSRPLQAWYGIQSPDQLKKTIGLVNDPRLQEQIRANSPTPGL